jgi:hypothetical protein
MACILPEASAAHILSFLVASLSRDEGPAARAPQDEKRTIQAILAGKPSLREGRPRDAVTSGHDQPFKDCGLNDCAGQIFDVFGGTVPAP